MSLRLLVIIDQTILCLAKQAINGIIYCIEPLWVPRSLSIFSTLPFHHCMESSSVVQAWAPSLSPAGDDRAGESPADVRKGTLDIIYKNK